MIYEKHECIILKHGKIYIHFHPHQKTTNKFELSETIQRAQKSDKKL